MPQNYVAIIDFGSQTTMLIARRLRELSVMASVMPAHNFINQLREHPPIAVILSGGPESLVDTHAPRPDAELFHFGVPMLGICYGMQLIVDHFGDHVVKAHAPEFGKRAITLCESSLLFDGLPSPLHVWMSHSDEVDIKNNNFSTIAKSESCPHVAIRCVEKEIYGVQFHPEVSHTELGIKILENFIFKIAKATRNFDTESIHEKKIREIKEQVGDAQVLMGLSGGVDSTVAAALIHQAIGKQLHSVYVNHGLHRQGELEEITHLFEDVLHLDLHVVDAREQFFSSLSEVIDPEIKRKKIGHAFVQVFEKEAARFPNIKFLAQGTLYPDVIESSSKGHPSHVIKSHRNVGGLPEKMSLQLLEPLKDLFKDEVRKLGVMLGLPDKILQRQPFPGPGMAVRIPGIVSQERVLLLQKADAIVREEIEKAYEHGVLTTQMWQWFAILLPVKSVGVKGDGRVYGDAVVIRCVESDDAMTADWSKIPFSLLAHMSARITNEVKGVSRVLYDVTQKPPGTIEWE